MNGKICIMKCITDIQNPDSEYMHSHDSNVDYELVRTCHWTVVLIKINNLNMITPIFTVECNKFPYIRKVAFLNTWNNGLMEILFFFVN